MVELHRSSVLSISLGDMTPGEWRYLSPEELRVLDEVLSESERPSGEREGETSERLTEEDWEEARRSLRGSTATELKERGIVARGGGRWKGTAGDRRGRGKAEGPQSQLGRTGLVR